MNSSAGFYDLNGLLTITPDNKNKIVLFGYFSNDNFGLSNNGNSFDITKYQYANTLTSIRWNHNFAHHLSSSLMTGISRYKFQMNELDTTRRSEGYQLSSGILYNNAKWDLAWHPDNNYAFDFGANAVFYTVEPGSLAPNKAQSQVTPVHENSTNASEYSIYLSTDMNINKDLSAEIGLRYTLYNLNGPGNVYIYKDGTPDLAANIIDSVNYNNNQLIKRYHGLEPRISFSYSINSSSSVKISYNLIHQYIQLVSNSAVMSPVDYWKLSDQYLKPLQCNQYAAGYFRNFQNNKIPRKLQTARKHGI